LLVHVSFDGRMPPGLSSLSIQKLLSADWLLAHAMGYFVQLACPLKSNHDGNFMEEVVDGGSPDA